MWTQLWVINVELQLDLGYRVLRFASITNIESWPQFARIWKEVARAQHRGQTNVVKMFRVHRYFYVNAFSCERNSRKTIRLLWKKKKKKKKKFIVDLTWPVFYRPWNGWKETEGFVQGKAWLTNALKMAFFTTLVTSF